MVINVINSVLSRKYEELRFEIRRNKSDDVLVYTLVENFGSGIVKFDQYNGNGAFICEQRR